MIVSWWDVFQALADGTSIVPSCWWLIRDRCTVTSPKVVLKVWGRVPRRWMPPPFAVPLLKDQFFVGLFDQDLEQLPLDLSDRPADVGLDLSGRRLSWGGMGKAISSNKSREAYRPC